MTIPRPVLKGGAQGFAVGQWRIGPHVVYIFAFQRFGESVKPVLHFMPHVVDVRYSTGYSYTILTNIGSQFA